MASSTLKRFREHLQFFDFKSVILTIIVFASVSLIFYVKVVRHWNQYETEVESLKGRAHGTILSLVPHQEITHSSRSGTYIRVDRYSIKYEYDVNGVTYINEEDVVPGPRTHRLIESIKTTGKFLVAFDEEDPNESRLIEDW